MSRVPKNVMDLPLHDRALLALRAAVRKAKAEHIRAGMPFYVWRDGKIVDLLEKKSRRRSAPRLKPKKRVSKR